MRPAPGRRGRGSRRRSRRPAGRRPTASVRTGSPSTVVTSCDRTSPDATRSASAWGQPGKAAAAGKVHSDRPPRSTKATGSPSPSTDQGTRRPGRAPPGLGPRQRRPVGLGRVGGGQHRERPRVGGDGGHHRQPRRPTPRRRTSRRPRRAPVVGVGPGDGRAGGAQAVDRAGQGELGRPEAGHEVAPADAAPLLQRPQHRVDAGEAALGALAQRRLPGEHAVALEQLGGPGVGQLGGDGRGVEQRADQRPPAGAGGRAEPGQAGPRPGGAGPAALRTLPPTNARSGASESLVTRPAHTRSHRAASTVGVVVGQAGLLHGLHEVGPERGAPLLEPVEQRPVDGLVGQLGGLVGRRHQQRRLVAEDQAHPAVVGPDGPAPTHTSSPAVHSASRSAGR